MNASEDIFHLGVKAIVRNDEGSVLLLKVNPEKLRKTTEPYWDIPGGRIERGSTVEATLQREIKEELGVEHISNVQPFSMVLSNIRIPIESTDVGLILAIYTCEIDPRTPIIISYEHTEAAWFTVSEAAELLKVKYPPNFTQELEKLALQ